MIPRRLRTEYADRPLGIAPSTPRVSWEVADGDGEGQAGYRIEVAPTAGELGTEASTVRSTGWRDTPQSTHVSLPGTYGARERWYWRVQVRSAVGTVSAWSDPTWFECGLSSETFGGDWIAAPAGSGEGPDPVPALRRQFTLDADTPIDRARLYVSGLGSYVPYLDGTRIGDRELDPPLSDYTERVLYSTYDVTDRLSGDVHVLGFLLGRGWYAMATESSWGWNDAPWHRDHPRLLAQLEVEYADGSRAVVRTDESWEVHPTPTQFDCLFAGEVWDGRVDPPPWSADEGWDPVDVVPGPEGTLEPQVQPPVRQTEVHEPSDREVHDDGTVVYEFPTMIAGTTELRVAAPAGTELSVRHGEKLDEDGNVDVTQGFVDARIQTDTVVVGEDEVESWTGQFSYKGFRYVQIGGLPDPSAVRGISGRTIHSDFDTLGSDFRCTDDLLDRIHGNARRGLRINYQGTPTDSPTYEKSSWTGDVQLAGEATMYNFDMANAYRKWLDDCADAITDVGELPPIVPTSGWGYEEGELGGLAGVLPGWDSVYALLPWWCYRFYGDRRFIADHFDGMRRLVDYFHRHANGSVLTEGLGDWVPPGSGITADTMRPPEGPAITSTAYYYRTTEVVSRAAGVLGKSSLSQTYKERATSIRETFDERFFDDSRGYYRTGEVDEFRQTSNVMPLAFGMIPESRRDGVVDALVADVEDRDRHVNTGILGTKYLLPTLTDGGAVDVAYDVATQRTYPSWGRWLEEGATTLYESWELNSRSRNHRSLTSIEDWFYQYLAGIRPERPGFEVVRISPVHPQGLDGAGATVQTVRGAVTCDWRRTDDGLVYDIEIPGNSTANITVPGEISGVERLESSGGFDGAPDGSSGSLGPGSWRLRIAPSAD